MPKNSDDPWGLNEPVSQELKDRWELENLVRELEKLKNELYFDKKNDSKDQVSLQEEYNEVDRKIRKLTEKMTRDVVIMYLSLYKKDEFQNYFLAKKIYDLNWLGSDGLETKPCKHVLLVVTVYMAIVMFKHEYTFIFQKCVLKMMTSTIADTVGESAAHAEPNGVELKYENGRDRIHWEGKTIEEWLGSMLHQRFSFDL
jgi:hypothetical protein